MKLACLAALLALGACGTEPDDRPVTFEVVALEVLKPTCGQVQCHSTWTHTAGYAFDTLDASRDALKNRADQLRLLEEIERGSMPPDAPLDDKDFELFRNWIDADAPGL